jgi:hypothetical protein
MGRTIGSVRWCPEPGYASMVLSAQFVLEMLSDEEITKKSK